MKTTKSNLPTNNLSLRAIQLVSLVLALIVGASWIAPTGHTSSGPMSALSADKSSSTLPKQVERTPHPGLSATDATTPAVLNTWTTNGPEGGSIRTLAIDPTNPAIVYAGTERYGVFKTTNSGASWSEASGGMSDLSVDELVIDPNSPNTLYANSSSGIVKSTNGGASWTPSNNGLPLNATRGLVIDPTHPNILYVCDWSAIFKSSDGGANWILTSAALGHSITYALAIAPDNSNILYAGTGPNGSSSGGVFKSTDAGVSWHPTSADHGSNVYALAIDPHDANTVYGSTFNGLIKTTDGGATWNLSNTGLPTGIYSFPSDPATLVIDPGSSNKIYFIFSLRSDSPNGGFFKSVDGGASWQQIGGGVSGDVQALAIDQSSSGTIYAGSNHSVFKSTNGGTNWSAINSGLRAISVTTVAVDQSNAKTVYAGTYQGVFKSTNGGAGWNASGLNSRATGLFPFTVVYALAVARSNPAFVYASIPGTGFDIFKSTDGGTSWSKKDTNSFSEVWGGFLEIAIDPSNPSTVYASGIASGYDYDYYFVMKTTDGGDSWTEVLSDRTGPLLIDPQNPATIYLGSWGSLGKSTDGGASWKFFNAGLPNSPVNALAIDPYQPNIIYAGTGYVSEQDVNTGVFKSTDGGATWKSIGPPSIVSALAVDPSQPNTIYAGTSGKGVLKSSDAGATWSAFNDGLTNLNINRLAIDASGKFLHAGTATGVFDYQYAPSCAYSVSALGQSFSIDSASGSVSVTTSGGCNWQASSNVSWITINSGSDGSGDGTVNFSVAANTEANPRTGTLTVAGQTFIVNQSGPAPLNPIDDAQFFVRRHYLDFLNREPDQNGLAFWTREIAMCGGDVNCIEVKRINVSAAYFLSIEFQQTGYLVYRMYKASYGDLSGAPVPITLSEFEPDTRQIGQGVVVNQTGWERMLENNKQAFASEFVQRSRFTSAYPASMSPDAFVDTLFANAGVVPASSDRTAAINEFGSAMTIADVAARARALRSVAENSTLAQQEFNRAFVLMQYFGYLRRNPNDPPEATLDFQGYNFWLNKLNSFNGNFVNAEMVKAFIVSGEYRRRFGP